MSFTLLPTTTTSSPLLPRYNHLPKTLVKPSSLTIKKPNPVPTSCELRQNKGSEDHNLIGRRSVLIGLGGFYGGMRADAYGVKETDNEASPMEPVSEFGSQSRALNKPIRALVDRPKLKKEIEVVVVDGIEIPNDEPVRFDVYIAKPRGTLVGPDYGEFVGSLVDIAHTRVGRNVAKGSLELGITDSVKEIEAEESDKLVVTLVPRTGEVMIEGVRIEEW